MDVTPFNPNLPIADWMPVFVKRPCLFDAEARAELLAAAHAQGFRPAVRLRRDGSEVVDRSFLLSDFVLLQHKHPVYLKFRERMLALRDEFNHRYDFALYEDPERCLPRIKVCRYEGHDDPEQRGFLSWHADAGPTADSSQRKLSVSCLLNEPSEFEGGDLAIFGTISHTPFQDAHAGDAVVFPAFAQHVVKRVVRGTRYVAILWFHGPRMR